MEKMIVYGYNVYQNLKSWYYSADEINYYMITYSGEQIPIFECINEPIWGFLTVYNKNSCYKYKFTRNFIIDEMQLPTYKWLGLQITVNQKLYLLDVDEFLVVPNILFTDPIKLWLCTKLNIIPTTDIDICIIDEDVNMSSINSIELNKNNYITAEQT